MGACPRTLQRPEGLARSLVSKKGELLDGSVRYLFIPIGLPNFDQDASGQPGELGLRFFQRLPVL
jgi:hypothetical protein